MALVPHSKSPTHGKESPRKGLIDNDLVLEVPLDYSFRNITDVSELQHEEPRSKNVKNDDGKYMCRCLRVNNNVIQDLNNLPTAINSILGMSLDQIAWIDFSFNELSKIDPILCDFPNLQILYLHGNYIKDIEEVDKLCGLPFLQKLTLHGNQIETVKNYRWYVLSKIPHLRSLDFSGVTKADRRTAECWVKNNPMKRKKKKDAES